MRVEKQTWAPAPKPSQQQEAPKNPAATTAVYAKAAAATTVHLAAKAATAATAAIASVAPGRIAVPTTAANRSTVSGQPPVTTTAISESPIGRVSTRWAQTGASKSALPPASAAADGVSPTVPPTVSPSIGASALGVDLGDGVSRSPIGSAAVDQNGTGAAGAPADGATAVGSDMDLYRAQPPADESAPPKTLSGFAYGSKPAAEAGLSTAGVKSDFIVGTLNSPPEVQKLAEGGIGNVFNPEWQKVLAAAVEQNGGLGNSQDGFLAYSQDHGFVRLLNPRMTPEQNRRLAEMSLTMSAPIEKIPSRIQDSALKDPEVSKWADEFIGRYDKAMTDFLANPKEGVQIKDGRTRYKLEVNAEAGRVVSYNFKKAGPFRTFMQKAMKYIGPVADVAAAVFTFINPAIAFAIKAAKTACMAIATGGKKIWGQVASLACDLLPTVTGWIGAKLTDFQSLIVKGALKLGGDIADNGKLRLTAVVDAFGDVLVKDLPGGVEVDKAVRGGLKVLAQGIETGKVSPESLINIFTSVVTAANGKQTTTDGKGQANGSQPATDGGIMDTIRGWTGLDKDTFSILKTGLGAIVKYIQNGKLQAGDIATVLGQFASTFTDNPQSQAVIRESLGAIAQGIDKGQVNAQKLGDAVAAYVKQQMEAEKAQAGTTTPAGQPVPAIA